MKKIEKLIPTAIEAVVNCKIMNHDGEIPKEYNGYISAFGASLISAGLLPTIIFYSQKGESKDRQLIIEGMEYILKKHFPEMLGMNDSLVRIVVAETDHTVIARLEEKLTDAAVALKLAIRTFPKSKNQ